MYRYRRRNFCQIPDDVVAATAYTRTGLISGNAAVVAADLTRLAALEAALRKSGMPFDDCVRSGQLTLLDSGALLERIMDGDMPNPHSFHAVIGSLLAQVAARGYRQTRVYAELVHALWRADNPVAAITLEELWSELAYEYRFAMFRGAEVERRLPADRRTMLWLRRNRPGAVGKIVARANINP